MKTKLLALAVLCACAVSAQTIAMVDMEKILERHPNTPNDKQLLETTLAEFSKERDTLRATIESKQAELEKRIKEAQNPMLAPAKADELRKSCEALYNSIQRETDAAEQKMAGRSRELSELEARLIKRTSKEILAHIEAYAKEKGYDMVVYKNAVPYVKKNLDITNQIIVLCGGKPEKVETSKGADELAAPEKFTK